MKLLERCCLFVPFEHEKVDRQLLATSVQASMPRSNLGVTAPIQVECLSSEKRLLLRLSSLVTTKDPEMLLSWDTQGAGLGYIIERSVVLSCENRSTKQAAESSGTDKPAIDMVRLLGRARFAGSSPPFMTSTILNNQEAWPIGNVDERKWKGSGLGNEWDERVGAGAAAASIVSLLIC